MSDDNFDYEAATKEGRELGAYIQSQVDKARGDLARARESLQTCDGRQADELYQWLLLCKRNTRGTWLWRKVGTDVDELIEIAKQKRGE